MEVEYSDTSNSDMKLVHSENYSVLFRFQYNSLQLDQAHLLFLIMIVINLVEMVVIKIMIINLIMNSMKRLDYIELLYFFIK